MTDLNSKKNEKIENIREIDGELISALRSEYNLKHNHIKIISALLKTNMDAKQLSKATDIPMGRIYSFLNELLENRLIVRDPKNKKNLYFIDDMELRSKEFMDRQISLAIEKKSKINTVINKNNKNINVKVITNPVEYYSEIISCDKTTSTYNWVYLNIFLPELFYPNNSRSGLRTVFKWFKKYEPVWSYPITEQMIDILPLRDFEALIERGVNIKLLIERGSLKKYFEIYALELGKKEACKKIKEIQRIVSSNPNLQIKLIEDADIEFGLTGDKIFFNIFNKFLNLIIVIENKNSYKLYESYFNNMFSKTNHNFLKILSDICKEL